MRNQELFAFRNDGIYYHHTLTDKPIKNDFSFLSHAHNQIEFYYFITGSAQFVIEGSIHLLVPGTLLIIDRNIVHNLLILDEDVPYERIAVLIDPQLFPAGFDEISRDLRAGYIYGQPSISRREWLAKSYAVVEHSQINDAGLPALILSLLSMILAELSCSRASSDAQEPKGDELVLSIIRFINEHLTDDWDLNDLQNALFRDKAYLNRRFRQIMGCSIWKYVTRKRVFNAQQQIIFSKSISYAFSHSGFNDYSSFYRSYKAYVGLSPTEDLKRNMP